MWHLHLSERPSLVEILISLKGYGRGRDPPDRCTVWIKLASSTERGAGDHAKRFRKSGNNGAA